jgi:hypothetical protein
MNPLLSTLISDILNDAPMVDLTQCGLATQSAACLTSNKELRGVIREAEALECKVTKAGKHVKFLLPNGEVTFAPATTNYPNAAIETRSQLSRKGLPIAVCKSYTPPKRAKKVA